MVKSMLAARLASVHKAPMTRPQGNIHGAHSPRVEFETSLAGTSEVKKLKASKKRFAGDMGFSRDKRGSLPLESRDPKLESQPGGWHAV